VEENDIDVLNWPGASRLLTLRPQPLTAAGA